MSIERAIHINGESCTANIQRSPWDHGASAEIVVYRNGELYFTAKVLWSRSSNEDTEAIDLSEHEFLERAWSIFKINYPFSDLSENVHSGMEVLIPWKKT